jgi:capsular exopolysaccharide synthesis family protein
MRSEGLSFVQVLGVLRRRAWLVVLCVVVVGGAAYGFSKHERKQYTASASLVFSNNPLSQQIAGLTPSNSGNLLAQQASNLELVRLGDMAAKTARLLGHGLTEEQVSKSLSVSGQGESSVVVVSSTWTSPLLAARIANTYTRQFVAEQQRSNRQYFRSALALVDRQLAAIPHQERFSAAAVALQNRAQTLRLLGELQYGNVQVAGEASAPASPSSPKPSRDTLLGAVLGLLLGLGLAFVLERLEGDRRIKEPEDLEAVYRLPLLGTVPESAALSRPTRRRGKRESTGARAALPSTEAEAFHLIRAHLRFFNVNRDLRTVLLASAAPGDGKSTIACALAEAAARMGSRVLLLECDLRHPTLAAQLAITAGPGLPEVLIGAVSMQNATQSVPLAPQTDSSEGRTLDVLTAAATPPPNPGELIESHAMEDLLAQARAVYDLVVIDTPPLSAVSDAFPLLRKVDGVIIVGWVGRTPRQAAERLHQTLNSSTPPLLGVIANATKTHNHKPNPYTQPHHTPPTTTHTTPHPHTTPNGTTPTNAPIPTTKA